MHADIISQISIFLTDKDCYRYTCISKTWRDGLKHRQIELFKQYGKEAQRAHALQNSCACFLYDLGLPVNMLRKKACDLDKLKKLKE